jgi:hypothetical protein
MPGGNAGIRLANTPIAWISCVPLSDSVANLPQFGKARLIECSFYTVCAQARRLFHANYAPNRPSEGGSGTPYSATLV